MIESLEAAARFRFDDLDDETITSLKTLAVLQGSRNARNFAAMVLHSLPGLKQAQDYLQELVRAQLGKHPLASFLTRCVNPPPAPANDSSQAVASLFRAIVLLTFVCLCNVIKKITTRPGTPAATRPH